jgi:4-hydroxy-tetrahydrodipicolinate reductase
MAGQLKLVSRHETVYDASGKTLHVDHVRDVLLQTQPIRVIQYGIGAMGSNMVRLLQNKNAKIVGCIDIDPRKIGRDVGDVAALGKSLGVQVEYPPERVLDSTKADVVLHATTAFLNVAYPQIRSLIDRGLNVVTITQELFFPLTENREKARLLDEKAKEKGVRVLATGINPGFVMDVLPLLASSVCWDVNRVEVRRYVDFSPYGPDEMKHIGAGLSEDEFREGTKFGVIGHIGLKESCAFMAHSLGMQLDEMRQVKEPLLTRVPRKTSFVQIPPGKVYGFKQEVYGYRNGKNIITLRMIGLLDPRIQEDGIELGDYAILEGTPTVEVTVRREVSQKGGLATAAMAVNMVPHLLSAAPGLLTMKDILLPCFWSGKPS